MTPLNQMNPSEATIRLTQIVQQAYHRKARQLPSNLHEIVDTLKGDLLKFIPAVPIETIDEAIVFEVLHDEKTPFSPSFLFQAVHKHYLPPHTQRDMDKDDLYHWKDYLQYLETQGLGNSPQADACRWWIYKITTGDTEKDTLSLLDTCAQYLAEGKDVYFNPRREFAYLVLRGQLYLDSHEAFIQAAKDSLNQDRVRDHKNTISEWKGGDFDDLEARCQDLCVRQWLLSCHQAGLKPSEILRDKMDERSYQQLRRTR